MTAASQQLRAGIWDQQLAPCSIWPRQADRCLVHGHLLYNVLQGVCRLVPDEPQPTDLAAAEQLGSSKAGSKSQEAAAAVRQRHGGGSVQGSKAVEL